MISQFFILSQRGDILINKEFRKDIWKESYEIFFREVKLNNNLPIFNKNGINYIYILKHNIYFVLTTRFNSSPSLLVEYLNQIYNIIKDFLGTITEMLIRKNPILIYEILDEMIDYGYPKLNTTESIKEFIFSEPDIDNINVKNKKIFNTKVKTPNVTYKPITKFTKNEIFIDVIEKINVLFNSELTLWNSSIDGTINVKAYLNNNPNIKIILNHDAFFDDHNFNNCVDDSKFNVKTLILNSPSGEFNLMNFRIVKDIRYPFKLYPLISKLTKYKISVDIKLHCLIRKNHTAKNVIIKYILPKTSSTITHKTTLKTKYKFDYDKKLNQAEWQIPELKGETQNNLLILFNTSDELELIRIKKEIGSIKLNFECNEINLSNVKIKHLSVEDDFENIKVSKWIRYITTSNSYVIKV